MNWKAFKEGFWCGANPLVTGSYALYWLGDLCSRALALRDSERWVGFWYPPYNTLMRWSVALQGNAKCGPWKARLFSPSPAKESEKV